MFRIFIGGLKNHFIVLCSALNFVFQDKNPKNIENVEAEFVEWLEFENEDTSDDIADLIKALLVQFISLIL